MGQGRACAISCSLMHPPYTFGVRRSLFILCAAVCGAAFQASAQNALDSSITRNAGSRAGTTLDRNLRRGAGGVNEARRSGYTKEDCDYRNLLVTGGVAGGTQFRGFVGYTAPTDFRGGPQMYLNQDASGSANQIGTVEGFLAGSALSNPVFINSARANDRYLLANGLGQFQWRPYLTPDPVSLDNVPDWRKVDSQVRLDDVIGTQSLSGYRSSAQSSRPLAVGRDNKNEANLVTSFHPLRGTSTVPIENRPDFFAPDPYEAAQVRQDIDRGMVPFERAITPFADPYRRSLQDGGRIGQPVTKDYSDLVARVRERAAAEAKDRASRRGDDTKPPEDAAELLERIRTQLRTGEKDVPHSGEGATQDGTTDGDGAKPALTGPRPLTPAEIALVLKHGMTMKTIDARTGQRIDELLEMCARQMKRSDYFLAEDSARTALALVPDHPVAAVAKANAQLGAGLLRSAGLTLHDLFISNPEMIDARFDTALLPTSERMRELLPKAVERSSAQADAFDIGLVHAYLGFQLNDAEATAAGVATMDASGANPALAKVLRNVWLAPSAGPEVGGGASPK